MPPEAFPPAAGLASGRGRAEELPRLVPAAAWSPAERHVLGVPPGLVAFGSSGPPAEVAGFARAGAPMGVPPQDEGETAAHRRRMGLLRDERAREARAATTSPPSGIVAKAPPRAGRGRWVAAAALLALAPGAGWLLGRVTPETLFRPGFSSPAPSPGDSLPARPEGWTGGDQRQLDDVLRLAREGRAAEARQAAADLATRRADLPGLWRLLALSAMDNRRYAEAEVVLARALDAADRPAERAEVLRLRARNFSLQRRFRDTRISLEALIATGGAEAADRFTLGETLRRLGALPDAVEAFARAEAGLVSGREPEAALAGLRRRLALVEAGREAELATTLAAETSRTRPAPEWALTAAAVLIQRSDHAGAARWMRAAKGVLDAPRYFTWSDDYFFRQHRGRPEYRGLFPDNVERAALLLRRSPYFIDP